MKKIILIVSAVILISGAMKGEIKSTGEILESYVNDFRSDPAAKLRPVTFGIRIKDEGDWHVINDGQGGAELKKGMPGEPSMYYITDKKTLQLIHEEKMSALTAMGREKMSDQTPLNFGFMEGFQVTPDFLEWGISFTFHFWTRGFPEMVSFGEETLSRFVHGAQAKLIYYDRGLRTGWYQVKKGQHINADPKDQKNPFPTLVIMLNGTADARIGGRTVELRKGTCMHIPAGVTHEFWNDQPESAEFIIIMFGEGA